MQVFPTVEGVEVFVNENCSITIRQESHMDEGSSLVVVPVQHISALCKALREAAKEARDTDNA